jgi:hypothetical protein
MLGVDFENYHGRPARVVARLAAPYRLCLSHVDHPVRAAICTDRGKKSSRNNALGELPAQPARQAVSEQSKRFAYNAKTDRYGSENMT